MNSAALEFSKSRAQDVSRPWQASSRVPTRTLTHTRRAQDDAIRQQQPRPNKQNLHCDAVERDRELIDIGVENLCCERKPESKRHKPEATGFDDGAGFLLA